MLKNADQRGAVPPTLRHPGVDYERDVYCLMGLPIDAIDMAGAVRRIRSAALSNTRCFVSTVNLNFLVTAARDPVFRASVLHSDLSLADGMPLVWIARLLGLPIRERVAGADLFERLAAHAGPPLTVYFFGGPDGAAEAASQNLNSSASGLRCVGFDSPGFGSVEAMSGDERIDRINRSGAQFVVVALGAAKGQAWIEHNRAHLHAPVLCHLGAVVNFTAGTVRRAPRWLQLAGGEWLWRVYQEPALWRRYWRDGVSLLRLLRRSVLPLWARSLSAPSRGGPRMVLRHSTSGTLIELEGDWRYRDLGPLRAALATSKERSGVVAVRMSGVGYFDAAFTGLLLLAHGSAQGRERFSICDVSGQARTIIERNQAAYLLTGQE